jgi:hypothetical protein
MNIVNLVVALALMGGLWVATVKALAASIRRTERVEAAARRVAKAPPRRSPPTNRRVPMPPNCVGAPNSRTGDRLSAMKDLLA